MIYVPSSAYYLIIVCGVETDVIRYGRRIDMEKRIDTELKEREETHEKRLASYGYNLRDKKTGILTLLISITTIR